MARKTPTAKQASRSAIGGGRSTSPEDREAMIREAAYYHYVQRGYAPGHDIDDWLEAEAELASATPDEAEEEFELQQSGTHGAREDDELKRIVKQHPRKSIPEVESVGPEEAPGRE
jgi:hypothetical protein